MISVKQKRLKRAIIIMVVLIPVYFISAFLITGNIVGREYRMFSDIDALEILNEYKIKEIKDKCIDELNPLESFSYQVRWNKKNFDVYAYVFEDNSQCEQYVKNRKMSYFDEESYYSTGNIFFKTNYIVYSNNKVLYIDGPGHTAFYEFLDFVEQNFDIVI